ncbi:Mut7-C RNAse domain-containing protein [Desulfobulbus sp.]|uniref:Mut7-C RNAse domain-containing protein n=1 Tax=Desulfobulbus sp. TaxID=895 RepID=UPI00286F0B40|nr:Mut7-C RNAse domain-containing protein [Desulfobulbus sp.]
MQACFCFHGDLSFLLRPRWRTTRQIVLPMTRAASIKDAIEAFGPPHTEIGDIVCNGRPVDFSWPVQAGQQFDLYPVTSPWDVTRPSFLRPVPLPALAFLADGSVGRLARLLRMAGFDTRYHPSWQASDLLDIVIREPRVLLSRNLDLLKRKQVIFGRAIRAETGLAQLREVLALFGITELAQALSRCLDCNAPLEPVEKTRILHRLEPLTRRYFEAFRLCRSCDRIYWAGSHVDGMRRLLFA